MYQYHFSNNEPLFYSDLDVPAGFETTGFFVMLRVGSFALLSLFDSTGEFKTSSIGRAKMLNMNPS